LIEVPFKAKVEQSQTKAVSVLKSYSPELFKVRSADQVLAISYSESTNSLTLIETVAKGKTDL
jgi:hypothetical protein